MRLRRQTRERDTVTPCDLSPCGIVKLAGRAERSCARMLAPKVARRLPLERCDTETVVAWQSSYRPMQAVGHTDQHPNTRVPDIVAVATSAQAITPAPIPQSDGMITQVRFGCGPGSGR